MSIFHKNRLPEDLSAGLDAELGPAGARRVQEWTDATAEGQATRARLRHVRHVLHASATEPGSDEVERARARVYERLERSRLRATRVPRHSWWDRSVSLPVPVVASAAVVFLVLAGLMALVVPRLQEPSESVADVMTRAESLNLQVTVGGADTEQLLKWLNEQQTLETVTIELPDSAEFQLRGSPVLLRPGAGPADSPEEPKADEPQIVPIPPDPEGDE